jgi:indole-3-glycerol phosphate synthase
MMPTSSWATAADHRSFLERIIRDRHHRVQEARRSLSVEALRDQAACRAPALDVASRLAVWPEDRRAVIAEIKRRSPSKGSIRPGLDAADVGRAYARNGAFAISVLTEPDHFGGSRADLAAVRDVVNIPLLYKDFVVDPYQIWEARACGADLVLLIVAALGEKTAEYVALAREAGLEPLVEVHGGPELDIALAAGATVVGVNNRDLKTFAVDTAVGRELLPRIPAGVVAVSESGLRSSADLEALAGAGAHAFLMGEMLLTAADPGRALAELVGGGS